MSIEKLISDLTIAINGLTAAIAQRSGAAQGLNVPQAAASAPVAAAMPAPPTFAAPQQPQFAAPVVQGAPFADSAGLISYVMAAYKEMGPQKGAQIQNVLGGLGVANINDVKPEQYGALYQGVEALKRG